MKKEGKVEQKIQERRAKRRLKDTKEGIKYFDIFIIIFCSVAILAIMVLALYIQ